MHVKRLAIMLAAIGATAAAVTSGGAANATNTTYSDPVYTPGSAGTYDNVALDATFTPDTQITGTDDTYPLKGDFNGDGYDDVFWYGPGTTADSLWLGKPYYEGNVGGTANPTSRFTSVPYSVGGVYKPFAGDFDGDGYTDIFWYAPGANPDSIWYFGPSGPTGVSTSVGGLYQPIVGDFDQNDGVMSDDIFWYGQNASESMWSGRASRVFQMRTFSTAAPSGAKVLVGNFTADNARLDTVTHELPYFPDLFFYVPGTGADALWSGDGAGGFTVTAKTVNGTYTPIVGTFHVGEPGWTGGLSDIFWYTAGTASDTIWMNTGTGFNSTGLNVNGVYKPFIIPGMVGSDTIVWNNPAGSDAVWTPTGSTGTWSKNSGAWPGADMGVREPIVGYFDDYIDSYDVAFLIGTAPPGGGYFSATDAPPSTNTSGSTTTTAASTTSTSFQFNTSELPRADVLWWSTGNAAGNDEKVWRLDGADGQFVTTVTTS